VKRAIITVGLGFGDEGKGATVDSLCRRFNADLVIRYSGGSQAGHNVQLSDGRRHTFSQFGAGTLAGVPTYVGQPVVLNPTALLREAEHLRELGVADPCQMLTVHPRCLVSTSLHQAVNQLRELARGDQRHGSCGHGIGETRNYWLRYGEDAVFAQDLREHSVLRAKLELLRQRVFLDLQEVVDRVSGDVLKEFDLLGITTDDLIEPLLEAGSLFRTGPMPECDLAIFEGAQGVLLDEWYGFHPYTTWSTVTPHHALELAVAAGAEEVCILGIVRAYATRHGAGPFPTFDEAFTARLNDEGNPWNQWQGNIRAGWFDMVLFRYAAAACGVIDNLAVSCLDHLDEKDSQICVAYENCNELPLPSGPNLKHQERLTEIVRDAAPVYQRVGKDQIVDMLEEIAPVAITASGPAHQDRDYQPLRFRRRLKVG
jgi:adenylosuccinate synthase